MKSWRIIQVILDNDAALKPFFNLFLLKKSDNRSYFTASQKAAEKETSMTSGSDVIITTFVIRFNEFSVMRFFNFIERRKFLMENRRKGRKKSIK